MCGASTGAQYPCPHRHWYWYLSAWDATMPGASCLPTLCYAKWLASTTVPMLPAWAGHWWWNDQYRGAQWRCLVWRCPAPSEAAQYRGAWCLVGVISTEMPMPSVGAQY